MVISHRIIMLILYLLSVNAQGVVGGSDDNKQEVCKACSKGACQSFNGFYTRPDIPFGYSLVTQVPAGACGLRIEQLKQSRNVVSLKISNGPYILNGDWTFSTSKHFEAAGTKFTYVKQDGSASEMISAPGPLRVPIDIMIVTSQANTGIKYDYSMPVDELPVIAPPLLRRPTTTESPNLDTRRLDAAPPSVVHNKQRDEPKPSTSLTGSRKVKRRKSYHWTNSDFMTPCSKSCGGGVRTYVRSCHKWLNRTYSVPVNQKRCIHLDPPVLTPISCNTEPCSKTSWDGFWGQCSVSCGEGIQQFIPQCKKEENGKTIVISDAQCPKPKPSLQSRTCQERECDFYKGISDNELPQTLDSLETKKKGWSVGAWSQCSASCGTGHRTRSVTCQSGQCHPGSRPAHAEYCNKESCDKREVAGSQSITISSKPNHDSSTWLVTEWSHCSEQCGTGNQTRFALCELDYCSLESKPETNRACSSEKHCDAQWFAGPWGECSDSCNGPARQRREVLCIARIRGIPHITNDMVCSISSKPYEEQACYGTCPPQWFTGDWSKCEGNCPIGTQRREVRCLSVDKRPTNSCSQDKVPESKRSCVCENHRENHDKFTFNVAQDQPVDNIENHIISNSCVDKISTCRVALQARLCQYPYYTKNCCESCRGQ